MTTTPSYPTSPGSGAAALVSALGRTAADAEIAASYADALTGADPRVLALAAGIDALAESARKLRDDAARLAALGLLTIADHSSAPRADRPD